VALVKLVFGILEQAQIFFTSIDEYRKYVTPSSYLDSHVWVSHLHQVSYLITFVYYPDWDILIVKGAYELMLRI